MTVVQIWIIVTLACLLVYVGGYHALASLW